jgi:mRNA-degrading endonuclease RelE of RelBE toxin-antitoxin system
MRQLVFEGEIITYVASGSDALQASLDAIARPRETSAEGRRVLVASPIPPSLLPAPAAVFPRTAGVRVSKNPAQDVESIERGPETWLIGLSKRFKESVSKTDRKRQGRILEAVMSLTEDPMRVVGDTVKPLSEEKKGYWRRRVGDYRLTYFPDPDSGCITLVDFEARGSAYA